MDVASVVLLVHAVSTGCLAGLIWFVQMVHYPMFAAVARAGGGAGFAMYEAEHQRRTTRIVAPLMFCELGTSAAIVLLPGVRELVPGLLGVAAGWWLAMAGLMLLVVWVSTFAVFVPLHVRLGRGFSGPVHARLVGLNWVRTAAWTVRAVLAAAWLV